MFRCAFLRLERIERPELARDAAMRERRALVLFQPAADPHLARVGTHAEHVRPVDDLVVADAREAEDEAEQRVAGHRAEQDAADVRGDLEHGRGDDIAELGAPHRDLQRDAGLVFGGRDERAEMHAVRVGLVVGTIGRQRGGEVVRVRHGARTEAGMSGRREHRPT